MNYMLIENNTLQGMKKTYNEYVKSDKDDPIPIHTHLVHKYNITCMIVLKPEDLSDISSKRETPITSSEYRKQVKFATGSADGQVKIWAGMALHNEMTIKVSDYSVTSIAWMTYSKKLVVATTNRMISFYEINPNNRQNTKVYSRFENLVAVPLCMEYYRWPQNSETNKNTPQEKYETLLVGDDLGIIHKYDFDKFWHHCEFKNYGYDRVDDHYYNKYVQKPMLDCHIPEISKKFVED